MRKKKLTKVLALLMSAGMAVTLGSCGQGGGEPSNIIITNANVYTVDEKGTTAEAVVVQDGVIEYVGDEAGAMEYEDGDSRVIDANGSTVMPGSVDAHMHPVMSSVQYCFEIGLQEYFSHEEYLKAIEDFVKEHPDQEVYTGAGFMRSLYDAVGPRKEDLDKISSDKPIMLTSADGHSTWVNSKALEMAGITAETEDPEGGVIQRDPETGEPSGLLQESAAKLVADLKPEYTKDQYKEAITWLQEWLNERGITTIYDASIGLEDEAVYMAYQEMAEAGELTVRVRGIWSMAPEMGDVEELSARIDEGIAKSEEFTTDYFQIIGFKFFADQVLEEGTAYIDGQYSEEYGGGSGIKVWDDDVLAELFTKIDAAGYQIHIHQIGNAAATYALDALEAAREANGENDSRHTFVHTQYVSDENIARMAELNMNAIIAPYWSVRDDYYYDIYVPAVGQEAADNMYPAQSFVDAGLNVATHSDFFVTEPDLGWLYYSAVTRTLPQKIFDFWYEGMDGYVRTTDREAVAEGDEYVIGPLKPYDECMKLEDIVKASTYGGAYACFMEDEIGSLEKGKKADLLILDQNIFESDIEDVSNLKVKTTIFDGKVVFEEEE
ncbi:amidohydrolase [Gallibacter sp. Marseille-QA0791]|uniref:amidohydrolase n=1 Tax=Gallibacter sp. Marseille-QA0791 TaxID=3378781 RepID=UPI002EA088CD|nr:amidohydrolase [Anaerovoracaceae bacterium]